VSRERRKYFLKVAGTPLRHPFFGYWCPSFVKRDKREIYSPGIKRVCYEGVYGVNKYKPRGGGFWIPAFAGMTGVTEKERGAFAPPLFWLAA